MADSPEERAHWRAVLQAFDGYMQYHLSANHARRMAFLSLAQDERALYETIGFRDKLDAVDEGIRRNAEFIDEVIADPVFADILTGDHQDNQSYDDAESNGRPSHSHSSASQKNGAEPHSRDIRPHSHDSHSHGPSHGSHSHDAHSHSAGSRSKRNQAEKDLAQEKVCSTLRSFVRDWADEGANERKACYDPCLEALERYFTDDSSGQDVDEPVLVNGVVRQKRSRGEIKVLVPGCGLGRLAMEIAARGFFSQGNEFSTYMLLASHFILNQTTGRHAHSFYPHLHSFSNQPSTLHNLLRCIQIPDVCPRDVLGGGKGGEFSLVAGDFEDIYGEKSWDEAKGVEDGQGQREKWGAIVTCFFIDCARNILTYLRIIHTILADDGVWINLGPLLWHFENATTTSAKGEGSIELSLDEVKQLARNVGFDIRDEKDIDTTYTGTPDNMLKHEYKAAFWTATKRKFTQDK